MNNNMANPQEWDNVYRQQSDVLTGTPPWNIGKPQPEIDALIAQNFFVSPILDAGCGHAEASLKLASQGHTVVGVDISPTAIEVARAAANERSLSHNATYEVADITALSGYDGHFNSIVDSTLFHSLPVEKRSHYLSSISAASASGAKIAVLVFTTAFTEFLLQYIQAAPWGVTEQELRETVSPFFDIDEILPAYIHANLPESMQDSEESSLSRHFDKDENGLYKVPAFLLIAHKK